MKDSEILRKQLIKTIHTLRNNTELSDDESYHWALEQRYGKSSSKDLSLAELKDFVEALGGKTSRFGGKARYFKQEKAKKGKASQGQLNMIQSIWSKHSRNPSQWALREFINNIIKKKPMFLHYLSQSEANKVIQGLKKLEECALK